jgi:hypothetical protein
MLGCLGSGEKHEIPKLCFIIDGASLVDVSATASGVVLWVMRKSCWAVWAWVGLVILR